MYNEPECITQKSPLHEVQLHVVPQGNRLKSGAVVVGTYPTDCCNLSQLRLFKICISTHEKNLVLLPRIGSTEISLIP